MNKRMTNVRQKVNGTFEARRMMDGKSYSASGRTKRDALDALENKLADVRDGIDIEKKFTVQEWGTEWMKTYKEGSVKPATMKNYNSDFRLHIVPHIGHVKLSDLTTFQVQKTYKKLEVEGLSPKSIRNVHGMLHEMLEKAVHLDMVRKNVAKYCELPAVQKHEMYILSDKELRQFLDTAKDDFYYRLFYIAFFTGLRVGELIGLTWDCIDFDKGTVRIYRQFRRIESGPEKGKLKFTSPKNGKERTIKPAPSVMGVFRQLKRAQDETRIRTGGVWKNPNGFVFTRADGGFVYHKALHEHFKPLVSSIGRPEMRLHDMRHTYATLSLQSGVDIKTLSMSLGHATVAFTLDRYGHVNDAMQKDASEKMERLIAGL